MANSDLATLEASQGAQSSTLDALILPPDELLSGQGQIGHEMVADFCQSLGSTEPEVCTRDTAIGDKDPTPGPVSDLKANDRPIEQIMHDINVTAGRSEIIRSKDAEMHAAESAEQCKLVEHSAQSGFQNEISGSPQSFESTVPALPVVPDLKQSIVDPDTIMEEFWKTWSRMYDTQTLNHSKTIKSSLVANSPESAEALHCSVAAADEANKAVQTRLLFRFPSKLWADVQSSSYQLVDCQYISGRGIFDNTEGDCLCHELDTSMVCDDSSICVNRGMQLECAPTSLCSSRCRNQRFKQREYAKVSTFETSRKGLGLQADVSLEVDTFVIEYVGEIIDGSEYHRRISSSVVSSGRHFYTMYVKNDVYIDAGRTGNLARFCNHSCDPNCEVQFWVSGGRLRVGIFTIKSVEKGAEITIDYKFHWNGVCSIVCHCQAPKCRGRI